MKMKYLVALTLSLLLGASCSNELPAGQDDNSLFGEVPEGMFEYRFTLQGITPTRLSYADVPMEANEMKINNAKVLVFGQAAAGALSATDKLVCVKDAKIMNNKINFLIDKNTNFYGAVKVSIVQICNYDNSNISSMTLIPGTTTYGDVFNNLESQGDAGAEIEVRGLLQIGKSIDNNVPTGSAKLILGNITIRRPFARFDVKNEGMKALTITALKVKNISNKFYVLSEKFPADAIFTHQKELSVPAGLKLPTDGSKPDPKFVPGVLYSYPGSTAGDDSPVLLVTGKLVTGAGKEEILTDKEVPFAKGANKLKIATNKRYTLTLKAELDGIVVDIAESFAEWGSVEDASLTYESDLDSYATVARVDENLKLTGIKQDGTFQFEGQARENFNFSVESVPEGTVVTATVAGENQTVETVGSYGELTHYNVLLTNKVQMVLNKAQLIDIKGTSTTGETLFHIEINYLKGLLKYPMPDGSALPAIYDATLSLWWAPVNVGAKDVNDSGKLFQFGRNKGWDNVDAVIAAVNYSYLDISTEPDSETDDVFYVGPKVDFGSIPSSLWYSLSQRELFMKNIFPKWKDISDGTNNPCPAGWIVAPYSAFSKVLHDRTPYGSNTFTGFYLLLDGQKLRFPTGGGYAIRRTGNIIDKVTNRGLYWESGTPALSSEVMYEFGGSYPLIRKLEGMKYTAVGSVRCIHNAF